MTANVRIITEQRESVLQLPNAALRFRPPGSEAEPGQRAPGAGARPAPGPGGPGGPPSGGRAGTRGRAWALDTDGKPKQIALQLGISDGSSTEIVGGDLAEQQHVIVGLGGGDRTAPAGAGGPRLRL
jgi:HlyD family secretion protein